jgi:hypothetical protein
MNMSTFQQLCPSCNRRLELPGEATGRLAQCPACDATFTIGQPQQSGAAEISPLPEQPATEPAQHPPLEPSQAELVASPASPPENPFSAPLQSDLSVELPAERGSAVRYDRDPVAEVESIPIVPRSIEEILSATLSIFGANWLLLVFGFLVLLIAPTVVAVVYVNLITGLSEAGAGGLAGLGILVGIPLGIVILGYQAVGIARFVIAVARNSPSPIMDSLPTLRIVGQFLAGVAAMIVVGAVGFLLAAVVVGMVSALGNQGLTGFVAGLAMILGIAGSMVACWLLWAWLLIVSDGRGRGIRSIRVACTLSLHTKLTSALMVLVTVAMSAFGLALCYVGVLITEPFLMLMFAVAYLLITNQRLEEPRGMSN